MYKIQRDTIYLVTYILKCESIPDAPMQIPLRFMFKIKKNK